MVAVKSVWQKGFLESGAPKEEHFEIKESELSGVTADNQPEEDGAVIVEVRYMSCDPYMRGFLKSQGRPAEEGKKIVSAFVSGIILASRNENWKVNDLFGGSLPLSTVQVVPAKAVAGLWNLSQYIGEESLSQGIGALGMPGSTAYGGFIDVLEPKEGQTIFVSAASGAVGSIVGQIAKNVYKCTTVGSCGGQAKCEHIKSDFGYDHAIDYKSIDQSGADKGAAELKAKLKEAVPMGIDMYFENVGGIHFDAAMNSLRPKGRVAVCGGISGYNDKDGPRQEVDILSLIYTAQRIEGFVCTPWLTGQQGNFLGDMSQWIKEGKVKVEETTYNGVEQWATAFNSLFENTHRNKGKVVVKV
ncbi:hypothetical protein SARC_12434 [Sphaeroforma arctica JP610]|uniref:Enoyl reductase (ER) domain-containing protein n=1 Tax=Sphaeroforma arctica JP610 TaxID=667725 RepID=A0A0L0FG65_9EUKA|nr:hypothetical protein SARC_12434 [Sphaeroforma arctica JP610]KNC75033.1 hypothetical protein SARC_12434 [Sphaeroforma arctica JP610]|eukprot:XP_014148935.1 hypothetical protein SARC_12434 [Sphaeroforma arctica JP610]